ncbi:hypothetical protein GQ457_01G025770 [Hibiscus cannabinus]
MTSHSHVAIPFKLIEPGPRRLIRVRHGNEPNHFFENRLVAGDRQWALVAEPVLFLRLDKEFLEYGMVQVRRPHHESPATRPDADRHVTRRHIRWNAAG